MHAVQLVCLQSTTQDDTVPIYSTDADSVLPNEAMRASLTINGAAPVNYFLVGSTPTEETEEGKSVNVKQIIMPNEACDHLCSLVTQIACACAQSITPGQAFIGTRFHSCHD